MSAPPAIRSAIETQVSLSPATWLEVCGAVIDKDGETVRRPNLSCNKLQRKLDQIIRWCERHGLPCRIVGLKARQVGLSTFSIAAMYHACRRKRTKCLLIGDEYEKSVKNLKDMFDGFALLDTAGWGTVFHRPSSKFSNGSELVTDTANDNRAGASGTYQFIVATEVAHWKETKNLSAVKVFQAFMACVPKRPGTVVIVESTANGEGNAYHSTYMGAMTFERLQECHSTGEYPPGWNGFIKVFLAWHEFPDYTAEYTQQEALAIFATLDEDEKKLVERFGLDAGRLKWRRGMLSSPEYRGREAKFEEEYPSDEESAFLSTGSKIFSAIHLKEMMRRALLAQPEYCTLDWQFAGHGQEYPALNTYVSPTPPDGGVPWMLMWERPTVGMRYIFPIDFATGKTVTTDPDHHGAHIYRCGYRDEYGRWHPRRLVARITDCAGEQAEYLRSGQRRAMCRWLPDILEERVKLACAFYGMAMLAPESNKDNGAIRNFMNTGYPVIRVTKYNRATQREEEFFGFNTDGEGRNRLIAGLGREIRGIDTNSHVTGNLYHDGEGIQIDCPVVVQEMQVFVRNPNGKAEAAGGWHDDQVIPPALGIECEAQASVMREYTIQRTDPLSALEAKMRRR